jgi:uncharacterized protein YodC (DUF2158 family)
LREANWMTNEPVRHRTILTSSVAPSGARACPWSRRESRSRATFRIGYKSRAQHLEHERLQGLSIVVTHWFDAKTNAYNHFPKSLK